MHGNGRARHFVEDSTDQIRKHQIAGAIGETGNKEWALLREIIAIRNDRVIIEETLTEAYYYQHDFNVSFRARNVILPCQAITIHH